MSADKREELRKLAEELEHQKARKPVSVFSTTTTTAATAIFRSHFLFRLHHRMIEERDVRTLCLSNCLPLRSLYKWFTAPLFKRLKNKKVKILGD